MSVSPFRLPDGFLLGTATAATQVEGGESGHDWAAFCALVPSPIRDGTTCLRACDHWNRMEEDVALQAELGCRIHRMGLEWSRLEPEEGRFDEAAFAHYRRELELLREAGILPMATLFHFSLPLWLARKGGFESGAAAEALERLADACAARLGDLVESWCTVNEPNIYAVKGWIEGEWPPGRKGDLRAAFRVMRNASLAHVAAQRALRRRLGPSARIGFAQHVRCFDPATKAPWDVLAARLLDRLFQAASTEAMATGRLSWPLGRGAPQGRGDFCDFLGLNYYATDRVRFSLRTGYRTEVPDGAPVNDLGWIIDAEGLARLARRFHARYRKPVWITENGTCDAADAFRGEYLAAHLAVCARLAAEGVPVERYYHWTLLDNFEWAEGESAPFGLVATDFATQRRTVRPSGRLFARIARTLRYDGPSVL